MSNSKEEKLPTEASWFGQELVFRKDVKELIEDKIQEWEVSDYCKDQYGDKPLKELLEEVEGLE